MNNSKQKQSTRTWASPTSPKLAASLAAASLEGRERVPTDSGSNAEPVTKNHLEALLNRQRDSFKSDMAILIQQSTDSLKLAVDSLSQQVSSFNNHLTKTEALVGDNFEKLP